MMTIFISNGKQIKKVESEVGEGTVESIGKTLGMEEYVCLVNGVPRPFFYSVKKGDVLVFVVVK